MLGWPAQRLCTYTKWFQQLKASLSFQQPKCRLARLALRACSFKCVMNPVDVATVAKFLLSLRLVRLLWRILETFSIRFYWQRLDKYFQILAFLYKIWRKTGNKVRKRQIAPSIDQKLEASTIEISKKDRF